MVGGRYTNLESQKSVILKVTEAVPDPDNPWGDDLLARRDIAARLTSIVATQTAPLTISLHGQWGTGKTFMLTRWQMELEGQGYRAIYFNAWEDDFCDDPLLAMIGQLAVYFRESRLREIASKAAEIAIPLMRENILGVLKATTGATLKVEQQQDNRTLLDAYLEQGATKDRLRSQLARLSEEVFGETGHPLIFIVDELDRCRPTFAIELLERVKHIFDVPHIVFAFGLNRDELAKSFASVYGKIDTDVYIRRFFDFEFSLPEVDSQGFAIHMIDKFQLDQVFKDLSNQAGLPAHVRGYDACRKVFPKVWSALGLSLRDIDYGIRLLALLARNVPPDTSIHPSLLVVLIAMKFKRPEFYRLLVTRGFRTSEIMNYIDEESRRALIDDELSLYLDRSEGFLYCAEDALRGPGGGGQSAFAELERVRDGDLEKDFRVISQRARSANQWRLNDIATAITDARRLNVSGRVLGTLAALIDTHQTQLRK